MSRVFNTSGPCRGDKHDMIPPGRRLAPINDLIAGEHFFVIHAPRQTGKTTLLRHLSRELTTAGAVERVSKIHTPTLVLVGELDMLDIHGIVDLLVTTVPSARKVLVPGVGHLINLEAPETFDKELDKFLATLKSW